MDSLSPGESLRNHDVFKSQLSKANSQAAGSVDLSLCSAFGDRIQFNHDDSCQAPQEALQSSPNPAQVSSYQPYPFNAQDLLDAFKSTSFPTYRSGGVGGGQCDGDDCASQMSCSSECLVSCPSQCGETGQGMYCDNDACADQEPCLDGSCEDACQPCMDIDCKNIDGLDYFSTAPVISDGDRQAAAALASFGDVHLEPQTNISYFQNQIPNLQSLSAAHNDAQFTMLNFFETYYGSLASQHSQTSDGQDWTNADILLAGHVLRYHNTLRSGHQAPACSVDHSDFQLSHCMLPKAQSGVNHSGDIITRHLDGHPCGYEVKDVDHFAYHLFADHMPLQTYDEATNGPSPSKPLAYLPNHVSLLQLAQPQLVTLPNQRGSLSSPEQHLSSSASSLPAWSAASPLSPTSSTPLSTPLTPTVLSKRESVQPAGGKSIEKGEAFICRWRLGDGSEVCGKSFDSALDLHTHGKLDHTSGLQKDEGGFHCSWSGCVRANTFNQRSKLDRHLQTHTGFKPVQCKICGEQLSAKQALVQHMRTHTGEEPWKCRHPGCTRTFKQQSALTMHERTHTGERPLQCNICGKTFGESSNLSKHRRTHNDKGNYVCTLCHKDFNRHDQLRRHAVRKHGSTHPEEVERMMHRPRRAGDRRNSAKTTTTALLEP